MKKAITVVLLAVLLAFAGAETARAQTPVYYTLNTFLAAQIQEATPSLDVDQQRLRFSVTVTRHATATRAWTVYIGNNQRSPDFNLRYLRAGVNDATTLLFNTRPASANAAVGDVIYGQQNSLFPFGTIVGTPSNRACEITEISGNDVKYDCFTFGTVFSSRPNVWLGSRGGPSKPAVSRQWYARLGTDRANPFSATFTASAASIAFRLEPYLPRENVSVASTANGIQAAWASRSYSAATGDAAPTTFICSAVDSLNRVHASVSTTGTTCAVIGLIHGQPYRFLIRGYNSHNEAVVSYLTDNTFTPLAGIDGLQVVPGNSNIAVSWNRVAGATRYLATAQGGAATRSCTLNAVSTPVGGFTCSIGGVTNGTSYAITVRAYDASGTLIATSSVRTAVPSATPTYPSVPNLAVSPGDGQAAVSWSAVQGATSYAVIARYTTDPLSTTRATVTQLHSPAILTGLQNAQTYTIQVTATGTGGVILARGHILAQPTATRVSVEGLTVLPRAASLFLSWQAVPGAVRYTGTAQPAVGAATTCAITSAAVPGSPHCTITGLTNGTSYSVSVAAFNAAGESIGVSGVLSATPTTAPAQNLPLLQGVSVTPANSTLTVAWTGAVAGATGYTATAATVAVPGTAVATTTGLNPPLRLSGLTNGTTYLVTLTARDASSGILAQATAYGQPSADAAPTILGVRIVPRDGGIFASWPAIEGAVRYTALVDSTTCAVVIAGGPHCVATGLTNGTSYTLTISAYDGASALVGRSTASVTPSATVTDYPLILGAGAAPGDRTLSVVWTQDVAGAVAYQAEARRAGSGTITSTSAASLNPPLELSGLANGQTYDVTLTAYSTETGGVVSNPIARTVIRAQPASPDTPLISGIRTIARTGGSVFLSWGELDNAARYTANVASGASTGSCEVVTATTPAGAWCVISGLTDGLIYTLTIRAYDSSGAEIAMNGLVAFTLDPTRTPLPPILGAQATPGNQNVSVSWTNRVSGADLFRLSVTLAGATVTASGNLSGLNPPLVARQLANDTTYTMTLTATQGGFPIAQSRLFGRPTAIDSPTAPTAPLPTAIPVPAAPAPRLDPGDTIPTAPTGIQAAVPAVTPVPAALSGTEGATARIERNSLIERAVRLFPLSTQELADSGQLGDPVNTARVAVRADAAPHNDAVNFPAPLDYEAITIAKTGVLYDGEVSSGRRILFESFRDVNSQQFHILAPVPFDALRFDFESRAAIPNSVDVIWEYSRGYPETDDWFQFVPATRPFRADTASARMALGLSQDEWRQFQPLHPGGEVISAFDVPLDRPHWAIRITLRGAIGAVLTESVIADVFVGVDQWGYLPVDPNSDDYHLELGARESRLDPAISAQQMGIRLDDIPILATIRLNGVRFAHHGRDVYTAEMEEWADPDRFAWDNATRSYYDGSLASRPGAWSVDFYERTATGGAASRYEFRAGSWRARTYFTNNAGRYEYALGSSPAGDDPVAVNNCADATACLRTANVDGYAMSAATLASATPTTAFTITYDWQAPSFVQEAGDTEFRIYIDYTCNLDQNSGNQTMLFDVAIGEVTSNTVTATPSDCDGRNHGFRSEMIFQFPAGYRSGLGFSERDSFVVTVQMTSDTGVHDAPTLTELALTNNAQTPNRMSWELGTRYAEGNPLTKYDFEFETRRGPRGADLYVTLPGDAAPTRIQHNTPFSGALTADPSRWPPLYLLMHQGGQIIGYDSIEIVSGGLTSRYAPGDGGFTLGEIALSDPTTGQVRYRGAGGPFVSLAHDGELPNWRFAEGETVRIVSAAEEPPEVAGEAPFNPAPSPADASVNMNIVGSNFLSNSLEGTGVSLRAMWLLLLFGAAIGLAVVGYLLTSSAMLAAALAILPLAAGIPLGVIPFWGVLVYCLFVAGGILLKGRVAPSI